MARKSDLIRSIVGGGVIVANAPIAKRFGLYAAVLLHEIAYWCNRAEESGDGWAYRTQGELQEATTIASDAQLTARRKLVAAGVLIEQSRGLPKRLYFRIDWDALADALGDESVARVNGNPVTVNGNPVTLFL